jgi:1-acyl-sn-glycerol-3-phosphate acyltransferase
VSRLGLAALARKALWRAAFTVTGGLRVRGLRRLPSGPCVIVANHNSHADTAALIAALPARRRPAAAAAADYWFAGRRGRLRAMACRSLCGAFPVRRGGGGSADLADAARLLAAGRDVIVFPEGTRSRDGHVGEFHRGAARLAELAGVPLLPVGLTGTRALLPPGGGSRWLRRRRGVVTVRIGVPVAAGEAAGAPPSPGTGEAMRPAGGIAAAREQVIRLAQAPAESSYL